MLVLRLDATLVEMVDTTPCDICAQAVDKYGDDTDVSCDKCEKVQVHSACAAAAVYCSKPIATHGKFIFQDPKTGETFWHCGECCAKMIQPAPPAAADDAKPAPHADSKNVPLVTQDEPADEAVSDSTEDLAPPPKRARASPLKECLEALRDKLGKVARQTFDVDDAWAWCDEKGAENISDIVELEYVDAFVAHLGLKDIPARRLKQILKEEFA